MHLVAIKKIETNLASALNLPKGLNKLLDEVKQKGENITIAEIQNVIIKHRNELSYQISGFFKPHTQDKIALYDSILECGGLFEVDEVIDKVYGFVPIDLRKKMHENNNIILA